jgi:hypothetical protein
MALQPPSGVIEASMMGEYWRVQRTRNGLRSYYRLYMPMSSSCRSLSPCKTCQSLLWLPSQRGFCAVCLQPQK